MMRFRKECEPIAGNCTCVELKSLLAMSARSSYCARPAIRGCLERALSARAHERTCTLDSAPFHARDESVKVSVSARAGNSPPMGSLCSRFEDAASAETGDSRIDQSLMAQIGIHVSTARLRLVHAEARQPSSDAYRTDLSSYVQIAYKAWPKAALDGRPSACTMLCCGPCCVCVNGSAYMEAVAARGGPASTAMIVFPAGTGLVDWKHSEGLLIARATRRGQNDLNCWQSLFLWCCVPSHEPGVDGALRESYLTVSRCASPDWHWRKIACTQQEVDRMVCFAYDQRLRPFDEYGARNALVPEMRMCCTPCRLCCGCCCRSYSALDARYYCASYAYATLVAGGGQERSIQTRLWADDPLVWDCPIDLITTTRLVTAIVVAMRRNKMSATGVTYVSAGARDLVAQPSPESRPRPPDRMSVGIVPAFAGPSGGSRTRVPIIVERGSPFASRAAFGM